MKVFCYGASGHGKVVADILTLSGVELLGFVDDDPAKAGTRLAGLPVIVMKTGADLRDLLTAGAVGIVTIGSNQVRLAKAGELGRMGFRLATAIHPAAVLARDVTVGAGTVIMAGAIVNSGTRIGANVIVNTAATVDHDCILEDGVHISPGANLAGGVMVGAHTHVGIRASIIQGIQTGADSIIGAGAVVIRDVPSGVTVVGNPARILRNGMSPDKRRVLVAPDRSIRDTLKTIDESGLAIALVADHDHHLLGTVTDGDVRRAILKGTDVASPVATIMNGSPLTVTPAQDIQQIRELLLASTLKHVPVVDSQNRIVDLITVAELLSAPQKIPDITEREIQAVAGILGASRSRSRSACVDFEEKIAGYANRRYAIAVNSAGCAIELLVCALGLGREDEVITSPFGSIAGAHSLLRRDAIPVFVDIDPRTCQVAVDKIEAAITPRTKAILAADTFGQPANYDSIGEIAERHGLYVIVDASESIGAEYKRRRASSHGVAAVLGFPVHSQITTGEGGAIVTDDPKIAELCRSLRDEGGEMVDGELRYERLGYDYRLADLNCALGLEQLERIDEILEHREQMAEHYHLQLEGCTALDCPCLAPETTRMSWFAYVVCLREPFRRSDRDEIAQGLTNGIGVNLNSASISPARISPARWSAIHLQPLYRWRFGFRPGMFPVAESVADRMLALPFHNHLRHHDVEHAVEQLRGTIERIGLLAEKRESCAAEST